MLNPKRSIISKIIISDESNKIINGFDMLLKEIVFMMFQDIRSGASHWSFNSEEANKKLGSSKRFDDDSSRILSVCYDEDDIEVKIQSLLDRSVGFEVVKNTYLFTTIWNPVYKKICIERSKEFVLRELNFVCFNVNEYLIEKVLG
jgi:hypothetical protein